MGYGKIDFEGILGVPFFYGYSDSSALWFVIMAELGQLPTQSNKVLLLQWPFLIHNGFNGEFQVTKRLL